MRELKTESMSFVGTRADKLNLLLLFLLLLLQVLLLLLLLLLLYLTDATPDSHLNVGIPRSKVI